LLFRVSAHCREYFVMASSHGCGQCALPRFGQAVLVAIGRLPMIPWFRSLSSRQKAPGTGICPLHHLIDIEWMRKAYKRVQGRCGGPRRCASSTRRTAIARSVSGRRKALSLRCLDGNVNWARMNELSSRYPLLPARVVRSICAT